CSSTPCRLAGSVTSPSTASAPDALTPSRVLCERPTPVTAQPLFTSNSITARPRLRAPNTTALRRSACIWFIIHLLSEDVQGRDGAPVNEEAGDGHAERETGEAVHRP